MCDVYVHMDRYFLLHYRYLQKKSRALCSSYGLKRNASKITHCIFDVDGTLLDTEDANTKVYEEVLQEYGHHYTKELRQKVLGAKLVDAWKTLIKELRLTTPLETLVQNYRRRHNSVQSFPLMPGVETLLLHLNKNKIPLAIATSSSIQTFTRKQESHKKLFSVFHHIVCGGTDPEVKHSKPEPDIFYVCASRFPDNPHPSQCLAFEDSPNGINAAFNAGMKCVAVPDKLTPKEACKNAVVILNSLEEFIPEHFGLPPYKKRNK